MKCSNCKYQKDILISYSIILLIINSSNNQIMTLIRFTDLLAWATFFDSVLVGIHIRICVSMDFSHSVSLHKIYDLSFLQHLMQNRFRIDYYCRWIIFARNKLAYTIQNILTNCWIYYMKLKTLPEWIMLASSIEIEQRCLNANMISSI